MVAASKDRDDLIDQREAARAKAASAINDDSPGASSRLPAGHYHYCGSLRYGPEHRAENTGDPVCSLAIEGTSLFSHSKTRSPIMATTDKAKNTAQQAKGKLKETAGKVSGNDKLRGEGKADQIKGNVKQAGEKLKDAFKK